MEGGGQAVADDEGVAGRAEDGGADGWVEDVRAAGRADEGLMAGLGRATVWACSPGVPEEGPVLCGRSEGALTKAFISLEEGPAL